MTGERHIRWITRLLLGAAAGALLLLPQASGAEAPSSLDLQPVTESPEEVFRRVFGRAPPPLPSARYALIIDGVNRASIDVRSDANRQLYKAEQVYTNLAPLLTSDAAERLRALIARQAEVEADHLRAAGLDAAFDPQTLALHIDIPVEMRSPIPLEMRMRNRGLDRLHPLPQARFSGYLTALVSGNYVHKDDLGGTGWENMRSRFLAALNWNRIVLEGAVNVDFADLDDGIQRDDIRISYDDLENAVRFEGLDLTTPTSGFQGVRDLFGVSAFRHFGITPYRVVQPISNQRFTINRPARVQVYINGLLNREYRLRPGQYDLRDIPFASGSANELELRIIYDDGETETLLFPGFFDLDLLAPGISEFAFNIGFPERRSGLDRTYDWDRPTLSGFYRLGVTEWFTAGANIQANADHWLLGIEALAATPVGTFGVLSAVSRRGSLQNSLTGEVFYTVAMPGLSGTTALDVAVRYTGREFQEVYDRFGLNEESWQARSRLSFDLTPSTRIQLSGSYDIGRNSPDSYIYGASIRQNIGLATLGVSAERQNRRGARSDAIRATLSIPLGGGSLLGSYDSRNSAGRVQYSHIGGSGVGSWYYSVGYGRSDAEQQASGDAGYEANRFSLTASHDRYSTLGGLNLDQISTQAAIGTSIAFADGHVALSRPIFDAFAIIAPQKSVAEYRLAVDPLGAVFGTGDIRYVARSDALGPAVVPDLGSYLIRTLEVHAPDAPPGISLGNDVAVVQPGFRGGYYIEVGSDANVTVIGTLHDGEGNPVALKAGTVRHDDEEPIPFFTNAAGRFFLPGLRAGSAYQIRMDGAAGRIAMLQIAEEAEGLVRLDEPLILVAQ